jgi:hypothetical protein
MAGWLAGWPGSCTMHVDKKSSGPTLELAEHTDLGNRKEAKRTRFSPTIIIPHYFIALLR